MKTQTIEKTGKSWKALIVLSSLGLMSGAVWLIVAKMLECEIRDPVIFIASSLALRFFAKGGAWWYHG